VGLFNLFQRQAINFQRQIAGPQPGQGMTPGLRGQRSRAGLVTAFPREDQINGPGRDSERILQQQSATPLNGYLAALVPTPGGIAHYKHAHRIRNTVVRNLPQSPYWPDRRAPFLAPNAYTSLRPVQKGFAPPGLQRTAGGLQIANYQVQVGNVNQTLAKMYSGAKAPTSYNQSGSCE
jgi:hypothetical protein